MQVNRKRPKLNQVVIDLLSSSNESDIPVSLTQPLPTTSAADVQSVNSIIIISNPEVSQVETRDQNAVNHSVVGELRCPQYQINCTVEQEQQMQEVDIQVGRPSVPSSVLPVDICQMIGVDKDYLGRFSV